MELDWAQEAHDTERQMAQKIHGANWYMASIITRLSTLQIPLLRCGTRKSDK